MGRLTNNAWEVLHLNRNDWSEDAMSAAVMVKVSNVNMEGKVERDEHIEYFHVETYKADTGIHVEQALMTALSKRYGTLQALPARCTIVFVAQWSPCRHCTEGTIPMFLNQADIVGKSIRVKFRFKQYYAHGIFPRADKVSAEHLWRTVGEANAAYDALANRYDFHNYKLTGFVEGGMAVKLRRRVVFAPAQVTSTSKVETWIFK
ncbi:hypothetical protein AB4Y43_16845 [Paraburkholderia sp. BR10872]|uniref:hypothetical protein n=1 Tax=Paraburkholderia sp. BR10872 TaxID=3236989 RepID=UPI0034D20AB4